MRRILLVARYYSIEPLGILYLAGLARDMGWNCKVVLVHGSDFMEVFDVVRDWNPNFVGFQIWTGYHIRAFAACDMIRAMGVPVIVGGPHATYFHKECAMHADYVIKGSGFGLFREILKGSLRPDTYFENNGRSESFPMPDRSVVYDAYPELGRSPIKSIFGSVGCPFTCTYCYAPVFNQMHGGFALTVRPVEDLIAEARAIGAHWPLEMIYFQDDIFGYDAKWLEEFARRWPIEVGVPFHCQIRLELTRHDQGDRRLDLFVRAGCTGITLAIESGNEFLRDQVLFRHMSDELILEGCQKILGRSMTLRTEQILAVPFSDRATDLATLGLNNAINPTMAWTSILAPYGGTAMGTIAGKFGLYHGTNDDLSETFFDRSVLRHVNGGPRDIERVVKRSLQKEALLKFTTRVEDLRVEVRSSDCVTDDIYLLDDRANNRYCTDTVRLQRLFNFLARVPDGAMLGEVLVEISNDEWGWKRIGYELASHLVSTGKESVLPQWRISLANEMRTSVESLPAPIAENPYYFCYFPAGGKLANKCLEQRIFERESFQLTLNELGTLTRRHLFSCDLYKIEKGEKAIAL